MIEKITIGEDEQIEIRSDGRTIWNFSRITGLNEPVRRTTSVTYSSRHGGSVPKQLYGLRVVTVEGTLDAYSCNDFIAERRKFYDAIPINQYVPMRFYMTDERILELQVKFDTPEMPIDAARYVDWQIIATARGFELNDISGGVHSAVIEFNEVGGWRELEAYWANDELGYIEFVNREGTAVLNSGGSFTNPVFRTERAVKNPEFRNITTGQFFKLNIQTSNGDILEIDNQRRVVLLNGGNINNLIAEGSEFISLAVGENKIVYTEENKQGTFEAFWRDTYVGV